VAASVAVGDAAAAGEAGGEFMEIDAIGDGRAVPAAEGAADDETTEIGAAVDEAAMAPTEALPSELAVGGEMDVVANGDVVVRVVPAHDVEVEREEEAAPTASGAATSAEDAGGRYTCAFCLDSLPQGDAMSWGHCMNCRQGLHYSCVNEYLRRLASRESNDGAEPPPVCPWCSKPFTVQNARRALRHHTPGSCVVCAQFDQGTSVEVTFDGKWHPAVVVQRHEGTGKYDVEYENLDYGMSTAVEQKHIRPRRSVSGPSTKICGTPGCELPKYHCGNCTPDTVIARQRASSCSELPGTDEVASGLAASSAGPSPSSRSRAACPAPEAPSSAGRSSAQLSAVVLRLRQPTAPSSAADGRMKDGVIESDRVESHPPYDELKGAHVCLLRCAYPQHDLHRLDAHFIGWRAEVEDVQRSRASGVNVSVFGQWLRLNGPAICAIRQQEFRSPADVDTLFVPSATAAAAALSADSSGSAAGEEMGFGETPAAVGGQEGEEAEPNMEDAAQSSADEAADEAVAAAADEAAGRVGEAGGRVSGLLSPEPLTSQQMDVYEAHGGTLGF